MSIYIFAGPTLSGTEVSAEIDAHCLPPVSQGDVYRVGLNRPRAIGIIDGYFESVPAVWHKEILWAMAQGIHVFGASSMGALRAAELAAFGMQGVGWIFEAFRDGLIEDDDEVAVAHAAADNGYRSVSEAMVNIRRTLAAAQSEAVISLETRALLEATAKQTFYPERSFPRLLADARGLDISPEDCSRLRDWLPKGRVNQKREDAIQLLRVMRERMSKDDRPKVVTYSFEVTEWWLRAQRLAGEAKSDATASSVPDAGSVQLAPVLDELRLQPTAYRAALRGAMLRYLGASEARARSTPLTVENLRELANGFRREHGLLTPEQLSRWCADNGFDTKAFGRLMLEDGLLADVYRTIEEAAQAHLADHLRSEGQYAALRQRALHKETTLASLGLTNPGFAEARAAEADVLARHFGRLGTPVPDDLESFASSAGFQDKDAFWRSLLREHCYQRALDAPSRGAARDEA